MNAEWREHPKLKGRFLAEHPDDLQVIVHDGGPRITSHRPEAVWVTVTGAVGDVFCGRVINQPSNLQKVRLNSEIKFVVADGAPLPVMVSDRYLDEREAWLIHPCNKCSFAELFDAPSDLMRAVFPDLPADAEMSMFTSFCPLCGGVQGIEARHEASPRGEASVAKRPWWKFWG